MECLDAMEVSRNKKKESLHSSARVSVIETFIPQVLSWDDSNSPPVATFCFDESVKHGKFLGGVGTPFYKNMPMIIDGNNRPWDIGNLYLMLLFHKKALQGMVNMTTIRSHADSLLNYLRWIEHMQELDPKLNLFYLPKNESMRVTYRYRRYLMSLVRSNVISSGTANKRMTIVVAFYRCCIKKNLVGPDEIENLPYQEVVKTILTTNHIGLRRIRAVNSSDLSIKVARSPDRTEEIIDGGEKLRPLSEGDQELLLAELETSATRTQQLVFWTAIFTGARIQTIGTLRVAPFLHSLEKYRDRPEVLMPVGPGTGIDTKGGSRYVLHIPTVLAKQIEAYVKSPAAKRLREKSFYGDSEENYVFLTRDGQPFYTSSQELEDRQLSVVLLQDRANFKIKDGQAIRAKVSELYKSIKCKNSAFRRFRFHDLRASYCMNYLTDRMSVPIVKELRDGSKVDLTRAKALSEASKRMGHANESTTELYLDYRDVVEAESKASKIVVDRLFKYIKEDMASQ